MKKGSGAAASQQKYCDDDDMIVTRLLFVTHRHIQRKLLAWHEMCVGISTKVSASLLACHPASSLILKRSYIQYLYL